MAGPSDLIFTRGNPDDTDDDEDSDTDDIDHTGEGTGGSSEMPAFTTCSALQRLSNRCPSGVLWALANPSVRPPPPPSTLLPPHSLSLHSPSGQLLSCSRRSHSRRPCGFAGRCRRQKSDVVY